MFCYMVFIWNFIPYQILGTLKSAFLLLVLHNLRRKQLVPENIPPCTKAAEIIAVITCYPMTLHSL